MTAYESLGRLRKENKERHRDTQCSDTLILDSRLMLGWFFNWIQYTCMKWTSQHLVSFSSYLFLFWEGRSEEGEKSTTPSFSPDYWEPVPMSILSLSFAMMKRIKEVFICVSKWLILKACPDAEWYTMKQETWPHTDRDHLESQFNTSWSGAGR